jgi:hypothetical protein
MRTRLIAILLAIAALFGGSLVAASSASAAQITNCSPRTSAPGATGSWYACETFSTSADANGTAVVHPIVCSVHNDLNKNASVYRVEWFLGISPPSPSGAYAYGTVFAGGYLSVNCSGFQWLTMNWPNFVRTSIQVSGQTGTAGANVYAPHN